MKYVIEHIVILARDFKTKNLVHYQCNSTSDIQGHTLPIKIFVNFVDFTKKLTTKTRLTRSNLVFILDNIFKRKFKSITNAFKEKYKNKCFAQIARVKGQRRRNFFNHLENTSNLNSINTHIIKGVQKDKRILPAKKFVASRKPVVEKDATVNKPAYSAVPFNYDSVGLSIKESRVKRVFSRAFLAYLQIVADRLPADVPRFYLHFDHSIFTLLFDLDLEDEKELVDVVESLLIKSRVPSYDDMTRLFRTMLKQKKITPDLLSPQVDSILDKFDEYFERLRASKNKAAAPAEDATQPIPSGTRKRKVTTKGKSKKRRM